MECFVLGNRACMTYQKTTGNQDDNTTLAGGLGVKGGDLVAHLLEGEALLMC